MLLFCINCAIVIIIGISQRFPEMEQFSMTDATSPADRIQQAISSVATEALDGLMNCLAAMLGPDTGMPSDEELARANSVISHFITKDGAGINSNGSFATLDGQIVQVHGIHYGAERRFGDPEQPFESRATHFYATCTCPKFRGRPGIRGTNCPHIQPVLELSVV